MTSSRSSNTVLVVTVGLSGVAIGFVLQNLYRRRSSSSSSSNDSTSTHAVRNGLSSSTSIRLARDKLDALLSDIFVQVGCTRANANLVANVLSYADARGIPSHGVNRADTYVNEIQAGLVNVRAVPVVVKCTGCCAVIDGKNGLGAVTSRLAIETALKLTRQHGMALVTCYNSNHYGAAGYWAKMALDAGYIGMSFTNTSPIAVPTGGTSRAVGTNPFCFFGPAKKGDSFQLDMATTVVPIGKIEVMDRIGKPVPSGWGVDELGRDCTDGSRICKHGGLYPLGGAEETAGYKGYGLGLFVEILCSVLSGASTGPDVPPWTVTREGALNYGHAFIVIDPKRFVGGFEDRLSQYLDRMRNLPGSVKVAGDPEKEFELDAAENGILLHESVATTLKALAVKYKVSAVPPVLETLDETLSRHSLYEE